MDSNHFVRYVLAPFLPWEQPALGVSSLKAVLERDGIHADIKYLNLDFIDEIGMELYDFISSGINVASLLGEMVFADALWGETASNWDEYREKLIEERKGPAFYTRADDREFDENLDKIAVLRTAAGDIIDRWAAELLEGSPRIIGFSTTFQQNISSLALAKRVRELASYSDLTIIFGGANCESEMGRLVAEKYSFIDHVISGEGEQISLEIARECMKSTREQVCMKFGRYIAAEPIDDLNSLPFPNFDDYFAKIDQLGLRDRVHLVAESSRGCWWGAKHQCTFCGLNGTHICYRSKSPERFKDEVVVLSKKYGHNAYMMADNILDMGYIKNFFPEMIGIEPQVKFFYETKSNLTKEQLMYMAAGGVTSIQPGIESLSTPVLKMISKGVTFLQNIQLLRNCEELGIIVKWNYMVGFPDEPAPEFYRIPELIKHLSHLNAPSGPTVLQMQRFSKYFNNPEQYGIVNMRHYWSYDYAFSGLSKEERDHIAYFFQYEYQDGHDIWEYAQPLSDAVEWWRDCYYNSETTLEFIREEEGIFVLDTRYGTEERHCLSDYELQVLSVFDCVRSINDAIACMSDDLPKPNEAEFRKTLDALVAKKWILGENNRYVRIVLDRSIRDMVNVLRKEILMQRMEIPIISLLDFFDFETEE